MHLNNDQENHGSEIWYTKNIIFKMLHLANESKYFMKS